MRKFCYVPGELVLIRTDRRGGSSLAFGKILFVVASISFVAVFIYFRAWPNASAFTLRPGAYANVAGSWKVVAQNGLSSECKFGQVGANLFGSCKGPSAEGTATGNVDGHQVHWRWQYVTHDDNSIGVFDFTGNLASANTITGLISIPDNSASLMSFEAKRGSNAVRVQSQGAALEIRN